MESEAPTTLIVWLVCCLWILKKGSKTNQISLFKYYLNGFALILHIHYLINLCGTFFYRKN